MSSDEVGRGLECDLLFRMSKVTVLNLLMTVTALGLQSRSDSSSWWSEEEDVRKMRGMGRRRRGRNRKGRSGRERERERGGRKVGGVKVHVGVRGKLIYKDKGSMN